MKVSYAWLRSLVPSLRLSPEEVAERLASRGAPVEKLERLGAKLGDLRVARVLAAGPHPNADRLTLCRVDTGDGEEAQVVCGAPNVRTGGLYPFVPVGGQLPGGMKIRKAKIRGEWSEGMLCSERELELGRDQAGILELPEGTPPGTALIEALGLDDVRLDVEVTANRPDLLSHVGIARELAPGGVDEISLPPFPEDASGEGTARTVGYGSGAAGRVGSVEVEIEDPGLCPRYMAAVIRGVRIGPSPLWLQNRLRAAGSRPINNVVDATNYVLLESGQPLHAFDLDRLRGDRVTIRRAREGEGIRTLDGIDRTLTPEMLAITDVGGPMAVAGVMGGEDSEVGPGTTNLLLECALFDPRTIRSTRKSLGLTTDASYRFERGVDPEGQPAALSRVLDLIQLVAGGVAEGVLDLHPDPWERPHVSLRPSRVSRLLGEAFSSDQLVRLLTPLGFRFDPEAERDAAVQDGGANGGDPGEGAPTLTVEVPGFRARDVTREIDLIEEVARTFGYDRFAGELGPMRPGTVPDDPLLRVQDRVRHHLVGRGILEAQTPAFAPAAHGEVEVLNPLSAEEGFLRAALLPGLLGRVQHNTARGVRDVRLFEIGTIFRRGEPGEPPLEEVRLAVVLTGARRPPHFADEPGLFDIWDIKGMMEEIAELLAHRGGVATLPLPGFPMPPGQKEGEEAAPDLAARLLVPTRSIHLPADGGPGSVGWAGTVDPRPLEMPAWVGEVVALEMVLPAEPREPVPVASRAAPAHPGVERDLALLVPRELPAGRVVTEARAAAGDLLERLFPFDLFTGPGLPEHTRSLALRFSFRSRERTLTDDEVELRMRGVTKALEALGVRIRGGG